jgi:hypothetical protein
MMKSVLLLPLLTFFAVGCSTAANIVAEANPQAMSRRGFQRQEHDLGYYSYIPSAFPVGPAIIGRPGMSTFLR